VTLADWSKIREEYEQGVSLRQLATNHNVSKTYIIEKRNKENWTRPLPTDRPTTTDRVPTPLKPKPLPIPADARAIARTGLSQLARHLEGDDLLPITCHKLISDSLSQYVKVLITAPAENEAQDGLVLPLEKLLPSTRMEIRRLLAEDERLQQERSAG